jgi:hypothetical protein
MGLMSLRNGYLIRKDSASWIELLKDLCQDWKREKESNETEMNQ